MHVWGEILWPTIKDEVSNAVIVLTIFSAVQADFSAMKEKKIHPLKITEFHWYHLAGAFLAIFLKKLQLSLVQQSSQEKEMAESHLETTSILSPPDSFHGHLPRESNPAVMPEERSSTVCSSQQNLTTFTEPGAAPRRTWQFQSAGAKALLVL